MVMMMFVGADDPSTTITEPRFAAQFLLAGTDTVANVDVFVDFPTLYPGIDDLHRVEIRRLLGQQKENGKTANGSSFSGGPDQRMVPEPSVAMTATIRESVRSGGLDAVGIPCDDGPEDCATTVVLLPDRILDPDRRPVANVNTQTDISPLLWNFEHHIRGAR